MKNGDVLYISVFNNKDWIPIGWATINNREVIFKNLEPGIVYRLIAYKNNTNKQVDFPVLIQKDKKIRKLMLSDNRRHISIKRKFPLKFHAYRRMAGGKFQASNNIQFDDAITLYTIPETNREPYDSIFTETKEYKYICYLSAPEAHCNMAEIIFFSDENQKVNGRIIRTDGSSKNIKTRTKYAVFDNDPLTFFDAKEDVLLWFILKITYRFFPKSKALVLIGLLVWVLVEAIWGLGQLYNYFPAKHALFKTTGSFLNPGPYGGFIALMFPLALHYGLYCSIRIYLLTYAFFGNTEKDGLFLVSRFCASQ